LKKQQQLKIRRQIEESLKRLGARVRGAGTDLTTGVMDISFTYHGTRYSLQLIDLTNLGPKERGKK